MSEQLRLGLALAIRERRREQRMVQEKLASASGKHVTYISMLETGKRNPSVEVVEDIAHALGTTTSELIKRAEELAAAQPGAPR